MDNASHRRRRNHALEVIRQLLNELGSNRDSLPAAGQQLASVATYLSLLDDDRTTPVPSQPFDFNALCAEVCDTLRWRSGTRGIQLNCLCGIQTHQPAVGMIEPIRRHLFEAIDTLVDLVDPDSIITVTAKWGNDEIIVACRASADESQRSKLHEIPGAKRLSPTGDDRRIFDLELAIQATRAEDPTAHAQSSTPIVVIGDPPYGSSEYDALLELHGVLKGWQLQPHHVRTASEACEALRHLATAAPRDRVIVHNASSQEGPTEIAVTILDENPLERVGLILLQKRDDHGDWQRPYLEMGYVTVLDDPPDPSALYEALSDSVDGTAEVTSLAEFRTRKRQYRHLSVLLATCDGWTQVSMRNLLTQSSHAVTVVSTGTDALDALEKGTFDMAMFSASLPMAEGQTSTVTYRFSKGLADRIPLIVLQDSDNTGEAVEDTGCTTLQLPVSEEDINDAIERAYTGHSGRLQRRDQDKRNDTDQVIDESVLNQLLSMSMDRQFIGELIDGFLTDTARLLTSLDHAALEQDWDSFAKACISIKGCASSIGAVKLEACVRDIAGRNIHETDQYVPWLQRAVHDNYLDAKAAMADYRTRLQRGS